MWSDVFGTERNKGAELYRLSPLRVSLAVAATYEAGKHVVGAFVAGPRPFMEHSRL